MAAILDFVFLVIDWLLEALVWVIIADVVISWLTAFQIINLRNPAARNLVNLLDRVAAPFLWPFRKIIPPIGGLDLSPMVLIILVLAARQTLLPALHAWLVQLMGFQPI
jgi:YggT family protein